LYLKYLSISCRSHFAISPIISNGKMTEGTKGSEDSGRVKGSEDSEDIIKLKN
jgi:hypothetical protein